MHIDDSRTVDLATAMLAPPSVALVGASDDPAKTTGRPLRFLRANGYRGRVYPVNPNRETVLGERAWPSVRALPEVPAHAFILTGTDTVLDTVSECGELGVTLATVLAGGFSESGPDGVKRERRLVEIARDTGIRLIGPNSLGMVNPANGLALTANAAFAEPDLPVGRTFVTSQSGSIIGALASRGKAHGLGFAGLVSTGSETDLTVGDLCLATVDDPAIGTYALFLENLRGADRLRAFAREAARRHKPVLVYKLGRSTAGAELAVSHTGTLAGVDDIASAFFADNGMARVETIEGLLESPHLAASLPIRPPGSPSPRVGVVTTTGGGAAMVVDQLGARGIDVVGPSAESLTSLRTSGVDVAPARIVDLTLAGTRHEVMRRALDVLLESAEFDLLIAVVGSSARLQPELAVRAVAESHGRATPIAAFVVPEAPDALRLLTARGVAAFRTPESCADAVAALLGRRAPETHAPANTVRHGEPRPLDEAQSYELLDELGIAHAPSVVIALPDGEEPEIGELPFEYPVAAKVLDAGIPHKSTVDGVVLDIGDADELRAATRRIRTGVAVKRPGTLVSRILVQPMASGLCEVLVGYRTDPDAGPVVVLAAGGELTEIAHDRSIRTAPVTLDTARDMITEVSVLRTLDGFRGRPYGDVSALAETVVALSTLAVRDRARVREAEINPLLVRADGQGVLAVDAVAHLG